MRVKVLGSHSISRLRRHFARFDGCEVEFLRNPVVRHHLSDRLFSQDAGAARWRRSYIKSPLQEIEGFSESGAGFCKARGRGPQRAKKSKTAKPTSRWRCSATAAAGGNGRPRDDCRRASPRREK